MTKPPWGKSERPFQRSLAILICTHPILLSEMVQSCFAYICSKVHPYVLPSPPKSRYISSGEFDITDGHQAWDCSSAVSQAGMYCAYRIPGMSSTSLMYYYSGKTVRFSFFCSGSLHNLPGHSEGRLSQPRGTPAGMNWNPFSHVLQGRVDFLTGLPLIQRCHSDASSILCSSRCEQCSQSCL